MLLLVLYVLYVLVFAVGLSAIAIFIHDCVIKAIFHFCYPMRLIV